MLRNILRLREPYRILFTFVFCVLAGVAFETLWDLLMPPHHIRWEHNIINTVSIAAGVLIGLKLTQAFRPPSQ